MDFPGEVEVADDFSVAFLNAGGAEFPGDGGLAGDFREGESREVVFFENEGGHCGGAGLSLFFGAFHGVSLGRVEQRKDAAEENSAADEDDEDGDEGSQAARFFSFGHGDQGSTDPESW